MFLGISCKIKYLYLEVKGKMINLFLHKTVLKRENYKIEMIDVLFLVSILILAFWIRLSLFPMYGSDYTGCFKPWMQQIRDKGGFASLRYEIGNYTPLYMYFITLVSYIRVEPLYLYKYVSVFFDCIGAVAMFYLTWELTRNVKKTIAGVAAFLLLPTVFLNSAAWAQSDMMNVSLLMFCLYFLLKKKENMAGIFFGLAFASKFQAIFFLPFLIIMCLYRKMKWRSLLWAPALYAVAALPAAMMGRKWSQIFHIYIGQTQQGITLSANYPNVYTTLGIQGNTSLMEAGTLFTIGLLGAFCYCLYTKKRKRTLGQDMILLIACCTVGIVLNFLPGMHDRYGLLLDVLLVVFAMKNVKMIPVAILGESISLVAYMPYLFLTQPVSLAYVGIVHIGVLGVLLRKLYVDVVGKSVLDTH